MKTYAGNPLLERKLVSASELAGFWKISGQRVGELERSGIIEKAQGSKFEFVDTCQKYVEHLRRRAAGRAGGDGDTDNLAVERARLTKVQRKINEIKLAEAEGRFVDVEEVERRWRSELTSIRSVMLAVPSRVRHRLGTLTAEEVAAVDEEIRMALFSESGAEE